MFQSLALRGLLLFVIANLVKAEVFVDDDIEAVIIQGNPFFDISDLNFPLQYIHDSFKIFPQCTISIQ